MRQLQACLVLALVAIVAAGTIGLAQEKQETPRIKITAKPEGAKVTLKEADPAEQRSEIEEVAPPAKRPAGMPADMPGEAHKFFEQLVGSWEVKIRIFTAPDAEPLTGRGQAARRMVLGDRFLMTTYKGELMGDSFMGFGYDGYDNSKKKYVGTWVDNMSTTIYYSEGELDDSGKVLTSYSEITDPVTGKTKKQKSELTIRTLSMQQLIGWEENEEGEWVKTMEALFGKQ